MNADRRSHELEAASAPRNGPVSSANSAVDAVAAGCSGASPHGGDGPDPSSAVVVGPKVHQEDVFQYSKYYISKFRNRHRHVVLSVVFC